MTFPDAETTADTACLAEAAAGPRSCTPVRGPGGQPVGSVHVDDDLVWVVPVPTVPLGAVRAASPGPPVLLSVQLARELAEALGAELEADLADDDLIDAAARAVAGHLADLPPLPLIGEPFGGEEGTD